MNDPYSQGSLGYVALHSQRDRIISRITYLEKGLTAALTRVALGRGFDPEVDEANAVEKSQALQELNKLLVLVNAAIVERASKRDALMRDVISGSIRAEDVIVEAEKDLDPSFCRVLHTLGAPYVKTALMGLAERRGWVMGR